MSKRCKGCGEVKSEQLFYKHRETKDGLHPKCKKCRSAQQKSWRSRNQERLKEQSRKWKNKNPHKYQARDQTRHAIERGDLVRRPCEVCGDPFTEAHHVDYSRPLDVIWLCKTHHQETHRSF